MIIDPMLDTNAAQEPESARAILDYWFGPLDDATSLDREQEPFKIFFQRWHAKDPAIDAEIRHRFEALLNATTAQGEDLDKKMSRWRRVPDGLLALVVLLDQLPRNMYRDTPGMYRHDGLAGPIAFEAIREYERASAMPLVRRMFLYVPLMHVENLTVQEYMLSLFDRLAGLARERSPQNVPFFLFAHEYARRHVEVVARFGRFPHRNRILGRASTGEEEAFLRENPGF